MSPRAKGGDFLLNEVGATRIMSTEQFSDEQRQYYATAQQFSRQEVLPRADRIEKKDNALLRELLKKAGELGLLMIDIPEAYGGLGLDKTTSMLVAEAKTLTAAGRVTFGAHTGIGTLPIVWFGTPGAEAEVPAQAGHRRVGGGLRAHRAGQRLRRAGRQDDREAVGRRQALGAQRRASSSSPTPASPTCSSSSPRSTARSSPPSSSSAAPPAVQVGRRGAQDGHPRLVDLPAHLRGRARCRPRTLLGEIGKGHKIAFNILNLGRLKLGVGVLGGDEAAAGATRCAYAQRAQAVRHRPSSAFGADPREARAHGRRASTRSRR